MIGATLHYSATMVASLVNTANGKEVGRVDTHFFKRENDKKELLPFIHKDGGYFVLLDYPKEDFILSVETKGYEPIEVPICFEEMDEMDPVVGIYLTPLKDNLSDSLITLSGQVKGLKEISAVNLDEILAHGERYDKKRHVLFTFEKDYRLSMNASPFGIISPNMDSYEVVEVKRLLKPGEAQLKKPLLGEFVRNGSLIRIQYGQKTGENGAFIFRTYSRGRPLKYLFRVVTEDETFFKEVDLNDMEDEEWFLL